MRRGIFRKIAEAPTMVLRLASSVFNVALDSLEHFQELLGLQLLRALHISTCDLHGKSGLRSVRQSPRQFAPGCDCARLHQFFLCTAKVRVIR